MSVYQTFFVSATAHFVPAEYPQLEASIQQVVKQLADEPAIKIEMLLSFVTDHRINSAQVKEYPALAGLISTKALPLQALEGLFAASRNNPVFAKELESYVRSCFATANRNNGSPHSTLPS